ncbi:sensory rhodopsin transducer [Paenibacillus sp. JCM 10914]|uniref:sensory rhodopsin transducer n=1 Tax=Paenibacillus sp. JCM 10914 TaxID=1236974 RepID=UPI0003CC4EAA|nr:sensory rhodopsin transducer [Paenibacillus sp. JCM 10914]GAE08493.1 predicted L-rhamnose mutarotase [Paenibacillus sp. JCM 10914]
MSKGEMQWIIPDGYIPLTSRGELTSHESVCVLNVSDQEAVVTVHAYFEDREPLLGMETIVPAQRTKHIRTSSLQVNGEGIPAGIPYAMEVISSAPVFVQYSRLDSTQAENALMSVMAYPVSGKV